MIRETNLVDLGKVTLDNPNSWNEHIKYEVPRQWGVRKITPKKNPRTPEERKEAIKIYQHNYYLKVTKPKRKQKRGIYNDSK